jgi:hypothetical protein
MAAGAGVVYAAQFPGAFALRQEETAIAARFPAEYLPTIEYLLGR